MNFNLIHMIRYDMGWPARAVLIVLLIMSIYFVAVAIERLLTFMRARTRSL